MRNLPVLQLLTAAMALAVFHPQQSSAAVPPVDAAGKPALTTCPATLTVPGIYHFDKIVFVLRPGIQLTAAIAADQPALNNLPRGVPLDIKVVDNPKTVADLGAKVLSFLGAAVTPANRQALAIGNVLYATAVCNPKAW